MSARPITLFIIDDDPIFRLGLATALNPITDLQVLIQDHPQTVLGHLQQPPPKIIIIDPGWQGWDILLQLKQTYPQVSVLLLSSVLSPEQIITAKQAGIEGYCPKGIPIQDLVKGLYTLADGQLFWTDLRGISHDNQPAIYSQWLTSLIQPGLRHLEQQLNAINQHIEESDLSLGNWLYWTGRRRELLASRWLVKRLLPKKSTTYRENINQFLPNKTLENSLNLPVPSSITSLRKGDIFEEIRFKLQKGVENYSNIPLETDILKDNKRQELFYLVLNQISQVVTDLSVLQVTAEDLKNKALSRIVPQIWENCTRLFLENNYFEPPDFADQLIKKIIENEKPLVQRDLLYKIPLVDELLIFLIMSDDPDNHPKLPMINLLETLMNYLANGVIAVVLNNFSESVEMIENLFKESLNSPREIARFRNNLSWKYRLDKYWQNPKDIFESQYRLWVFNGNKIEPILLEISRQRELEELKGIRWGITIALEGRDAIAPRFRAVVRFLGKGLVYILTEVIGRGIGLIGKGIIQGIGNSLSEARGKRQ